MKIYHLHRLLPFLLPLCLYPVVVGQQEEGGTCDAEGGDTCASGANDDVEAHCFPDGMCFDSLDEAFISYYEGSESENSVSIPLQFPRAYGEDQQVSLHESESYGETMEVIAKMHNYMVDVFQNDTAKSYREECKMRHELCAFWAAIGECEANPNYMLLNCAPACQTCHQLSFEHRCPYDKNAPKVWGPGDLNKMFERLTTEQYYIDRYEPTILSQPPEGPWVITLENVATEDQCKRIIQLGADRGYERSADVGKKNFDGTFEAKIQDTRTSHNAWCLEECYRDETNQSVLRNVENITGIPDTNSEYWQLLRYEETQFYANHHDYINFHLDRFQGARILTVFLYLNDVEEGGGTHFKGLDITVQPKTGRAVVWPSVLDQDPNRKDPRTHHEALPVIKGVKYGANAWIHQRSFKEVFDINCS